MRRRKTSRKYLCVVTITAITIGGLASIWPTSDPTIYPSLEIEYLQKEALADPPVIEYESGTIQKETHTEAIEFTQEEATALLKIAQAEAGNQGEDSLWLVMSVVYNRVKDESFPDNVLDVINEKHKTKDGRFVYQFETVRNGTQAKAEPSVEAHLALARIEQGEVAPEIIGFENKKSSTLDKYFDRAFEYKDHRFYTKKE